MTTYPWWHDMEEVPEICDEWKAEGEKRKGFMMQDDLFFEISMRPLLPLDDFIDDLSTRANELFFMRTLIESDDWCRDPTSPNILVRKPTSSSEAPLLVGGRRVVDAIVVSAVILLSFVYLYLVGYIDKGGSKAGSSGSLDFRDIYISILLFQAAFIWIKFRDVIPRGAVYHRRDSNKFEPRIKFPVTRGVGGESKRIPLGSFDTSADARVAYRIAAFYCNKPRHRLGRLDLGGGASFPIPALSVDPNLPYKEKVKQVGDQVLRVYAEFEERRKALRNLPPTSPVQQFRRQPLNSRMDSAIQDQGAQPAPNIHNGVDFNNPSSAVLAKTQHELLEALKQIECLNARVSQMEVENMGWEVKYSELEHRFSELERENGLLNLHIVQSQLPPIDPELDFDPDMVFNMGHEESLAR